MRKVQVISGVLAALLASAGMIATVSVAHAVTMQEAGIGIGSTNDALFAIENNRVSIVDRILSNFDAQIKAGANSASSVRASLLGLRADQLLSASLSNSLPDVMLILAEPVAVGPATHRYVAIAPSAATTYAMPEAASSFVVRNNDDLSLTGRGDLSAAAIGSTVVGYFVPNVIDGVATVSNSSGIASLRKDGVGSGTGSWIGFTGGGNAATGTSSAVAAGTNNLASGAGSFVGAGTANQANGTSSLVLAGFDNRATAQDALVGAGAGNRANGARSVIVGGGYNLAGGDFSFIGGGGRDGVGSGAAGTDVNRDHRAFGKWSTIGGGTGNVAGVSGAGVSIRSSTVAGGARNTASGAQAFVGGGGCNVASGTSAVVVGGGQTADTGACTFGNVASGLYSFVGGGYSNTAAGESSVALGEGAVANDKNSFVWGSTFSPAYTPANGVGSFNISAPSGVHLNTNTSLNFGSQVRQMINLWGPAVYGIGVQANTLYNRSFGNFAWFTGGVHSDLALDPGTGGAATMTLTGSTLALPGLSGRIEIPGDNVQQIALRGVNQGLGGQTFTAYLRTNGGIGFYQGGAHSTNQFDAGAGGSILATIQTGAGSATVTGNVRALGFTATSDRAAKMDFSAVNAKSVLAKVAALPVSTWTYIAEKSAGVRHIGPMAQDFMKAFNVGYDDKSISTIDASGVALTAIKGLSEIVQEKDAQMKRLEAVVQEKDVQMKRLERELNAIKKKLGM